MKRKWAVLALLYLILLLCSGCGIVYQEPEESSSAPAPAVTPRPVLPIKPRPAYTPRPTPTAKPKNLNLLTGEPTLRQEAIGMRPVAVVVGNSQASLPQYGISEADLVFELPVEGGVTRFLTLYGDYTAVPEICSIRSCRYYFPVLAAGFDAYFVHWGQDETLTADVLSYLELDRLDGASDRSGLFSRDKTRLNQGYSWEHTGVFNGVKLPEVLQQSGFRLELQVHKSDPIFDFNPVTKLPEGQACTGLTLSLGSEAFSTFQYNEGSQLYYKTFGSQDQRDGRTGKALAFTNVFLLETEFSVRDREGRLDLNWQGGEGYRGYYISAGAAQRICWEKEDEYSSLRFTSEDGMPLHVNTGKSYIAFAAPGAAVLE